MLRIHVPDREYFDNKLGEFIYAKGGDIAIEHSLFAIWRWESKWKKPFLVDNPPKTREESVYYIYCMIEEGHADYMSLLGLPDETMEMIENYINEPMTATTFVKTNEPPSRDVITAEILYWEMFELGIPLEFEHRHLNHLMTLIKVCSIRNAPKKKMSKAEVFARNKQLNEYRKKKYHTKG